MCHWDISGSTFSSTLSERMRQEPAGTVYEKSSASKLDQAIRLSGSVTWGSLDLDAGDVWHTTLSSNFRNGPGLEPFWDTRDTVWKNPSSQITHEITRARLSLRGDDFVIRLGKMALSGGVARIFFASSQTPRSSGLVIDPDEKISQDAIVIALTAPVDTELRILPIKNGAPAFALIVREQLKGSDLGIHIGRSDGKPFAAIVWEANVGDSVFRLDTAGFRDRDSTVLQGVVGWERALNSKWVICLEGYYNGFGYNGSGGGGTGYNSGFGHVSTAFLGRWYLGSVVTWEVTPLWKFETTIITNLQDPSALLSATVAYSVGENWDFTLGQHLNLASSDTGEFGGLRYFSPDGSTRLGNSDFTFAGLRWVW